MPERIVTVNIPQGARYDITVAPGLLHRAGELLRNLSKSNKAAIITDSNIAAAHLPNTCIEQHGRRGRREHHRHHHQPPHQDQCAERRLAHRGHAIADRFNPGVCAGAQ